jgi:lysine 6-dehydrogenase
MNILLLGAGRMGLGAAHDFASQPDVDRVTVADMDGDKARFIADRVGPKVHPVELDVTDHDAVVALMRGHAAVLSCVVYKLNVQLAKAAVEAGTNFCDLGGNNTVVDAELALDAEARERGVNIIPDCGLAPGMVAVLVAHGIQRFETVDEVRIRVGGLPQDPKPPLDYQMVFSVEGLINEYVERARVVRDGKIVEVDSMTELETLDFPEPFGTMEAFQTSGGTSTLPETYLGRIRELDYKTIRYRGHCDKFKTMIDLGLCHGDARPVFANLLVHHLPHDEPDVVLVRVEFKGRGREAADNGREAADGGIETLRYDIIDRQDETTGLSAMMRTTAFPAAIVALMMARGQITKKGALPQERCVPPAPFMEELAKRNIVVSESWL